jgi:hypothetical protein
MADLELVRTQSIGATTQYEYKIRDDSPFSPNNDADYPKIIGNIVLNVEQKNKIPLSEVFP